ncbi:MAG TPA: hypothetical protein VHC47_03345 [Mucilaginibacter sp.]|nr:hypothetical protein [Mucilaginibacter sp.]
MDSIKALSDGILFEGGVFLKWGTDIEADKLYVKKGFRADRVIYEWGERVILDGLKLPFKTICWNHKQHGNTRSLESIEFSAEGKDAGAYFQSIREHVEGVYGESKVSDDLQPGDTALEWKIKAVKISLSLFNKEHPKVHFEIGWWV